MRPHPAGTGPVKAEIVAPAPLTPEDPMDSHTITLDPDTERRLAELAAEKGMDPDELIREAITEHLDELAETEEAERAYQRYQRGEEGTVSLEELERDLGLDG